MPPFLGTGVVPVADVECETEYFGFPRPFGIALFTLGNEAVGASLDEPRSQPDQLEATQVVGEAVLVRIQPGEQLVFGECLVGYFGYGGDVRSDQGADVHLGMKDLERQGNFQGETVSRCCYALVYTFILLYFYISREMRGILFCRYLDESS